MSTIKLNRFGEIDIEGNDITYFAPVTNFSDQHVSSEKLEEAYSQFLEDVNYNEVLAQVNQFEEEGKYIKFKYYQESTSGYHTIRNLPFEQQLFYFRSLVEIAKLQEKHDMQILWKLENFILCTEENDEKVKALLYQFNEDIKIYDKTNALDGLKRIILIGLTNLNSIIGKPTRADFINKNQEVIDFAEVILESRSIEDIESNIQSRIDIIEQKKEEEARKQKELEYNKKNKKTKLLPLKSKNDKLNQKSSPKEQIKANLKKESQQKKHGDKSKKNFSFKGIKNAMFKNTKNTIITIVVMLLVVFLIMVMPNLANNNSKDKEQKAQNQKINNKITTIYRDYVNGKEKTAHQKMFAINYKKIPNKKDKNIYLDWLVKDQKYTKALDLNENVAYRIGENINDKNIDQLKKINSNDKYKVLSFFIASQEKDFQTMIEMQNAVDLKRKDVTNKLAQSYILTNQKSELDKLIKKIEKDKGTSSREYKNLNKAKQYYQDNNDELKEMKDERDKAKDEVDKAKKEEDKAGKKDKKNKEKDLDNARDSLENAQKRYDKTYNDILDTKDDEAISD
jgi:preprotein translocase subunit SecG